jgi:hypothetical protein
MRRGLALGVAVIALVTSHAAFAEDVGPEIEGEVTWTKAGSPYVVLSDTTVDADAVLTIEPGARIELEADQSLFIEGQLVARGTSEDRILFTARAGAPDDELWGSLVFEDSSVDAVFEDIDTYVEGSVLEHCVIERGQKAIQLHAASPYIASCELRDNEFFDTLSEKCGAAMYVGPGSAPRIRGCEFLRNVATGFCYGGAVYVDAADPVIQDNLFAENRAVYGGALTTSLMAAPIVGNTFRGNSVSSKGGAVSLVSTVSAFLDNLVESNSARTDGGGVHVCIDCKPHSVPFFMDNSITGNATEVEGAGGVGTAFLRAFHANNLHGNLGAGGAPSDFGWFHELEWGDPDWTAVFDISGNYWGTDSLDTIEEAVFHGADDDLFGTVTFEPVLAEPVDGPSPRITLTTLWLAYDVPGTEMPLYLTVYNPGDALEVEVVLMLQLGEAGPIVVRDLPPVAGATETDHGFRFSMAAGAVLFTTLMAPEYQPAEGSPAYGQWHAGLFDASTGERLGEVSSIRFDLATGGEG